MANSFVNRDQITEKISSRLSLTKSQSKKNILLLEATILDHLKRKQRVRIANFGTFYLHLAKSHHIVQINSKSRRLLLEQTLIKFKASTEFKKLLNGEKVEKKVENEEVIQPAVTNPEQIPTPITPAPTVKPQPQPELPQPPVPKPSVSLPPPLTLSQTVAGKTFSAIIKKIQTAGHKNITFVLDDNDRTELFFGRPRQALARVPSKLARDFLSKYFEIDEFDSPQFRFVKLFKDSKMEMCYLVEAHTMPTADGASVNLRIG